jgi:hypothetical protein
MASSTDDCSALRPDIDLRMSPAGLEPTTYGLKVPKRLEQSITFDWAQYSPELQHLIDGWPSFSPAKRAAILALVGAPID